MTGILYVNNYRGFSKTFIPIKEVNFFVGENSTGKTSILSLIQILGSFEFNYKQSFNNDEIKLGTFKEIYSGPQEVKKPQFQIGYIARSSISGEINNKLEAVLFTYSEKANNPNLTCICIISELGGGIIQINENSVKIHKIEITDEILEEEQITQNFKSWISQDMANLEFKVVDKNRYNKNSPLWFLIYGLIKDEKLSTKKGNTNFPIDFLVPDFSRNVIWIAPIRSKPKKTYDEFQMEYDPEGIHVPYLINRLLKNKKTSNLFKKFIDNFGSMSGLFDSIYIRRYGREISDPFELQIKIGELLLPVKNVGYGVSQSLPIIVELFNQPSRRIFAIQQPEVHLHPKAQAALGDVIFDLSTLAKKKFYIETHSDYSIDRFRINLRDQKSDTKPTSQILFFSRNQEGNSVQPIPILENGAYSPDQPIEFREFFLNESLNMLGI